MFKKLFWVFSLTILLVPILAVPVSAQIDGIPQEVVEFLTPWAYAPAVGVIVTLTQLIKGFADLGKFHGIWCFIFGGIFAIAQKYVFPILGLPPLQTEWGYIALIFLGTSLVAIGTFSKIKNTWEGLKGLFAQ